MSRVRRNSAQLLLSGRCFVEIRNPYMYIVHHIMKSDPAYANY